jgi:hypothetical protein
VFSNVWNGSQGLGQQIHEWTNFMAADQFCIRICKPGPNAPQWCQHIYDLQGYDELLSMPSMIVRALKHVASCAWNEPGDYGPGFSSCKGNSGT